MVPRCSDKMFVDYLSATVAYAGPAGVYLMAMMAVTLGTSLFQHAVRAFV